MADDTAREPLSVEEVEALAPDDASVRAARRLASPAPWTGCAHDDRAAWGACRGSGAHPYQVAVDTVGPAFRCTCPSRKIPCKHALGLMLRWAAGDPGVEAGSPPADVSGWLAGRSLRPGGIPAAGTAPRPSLPPPAAEPPAADAGTVPVGGPTEPADPEAAAARAERRVARIVAGMAELDRWLEDLVRQGLGHAPEKPYGFWETMAARLVDAQAPGAAARVRRLPVVLGSGEGWPERMLGRLALLKLLAAGWSRFGELPADVQADLRAAAGWPEPSAEVLTDRRRPLEPGRWYVLGRSVTDEERVRARRTWLRELESARLGVLVDFARPGAAFTWDLWPGNVLEATVARFPGSAALRVLVAEQRGDATDGGAPPAWESLAAAAAARAPVVAADPWLERWPLALAGAVPDGRPGAWTLRDAAGAQLALRAEDPVAWRLVAACGGRPATVIGEWEDGAVTPLAAWISGRMTVLAA